MSDTALYYIWRDKWCPVADRTKEGRRTKGEVRRFGFSDKENRGQHHPRKSATPITDGSAILDGYPVVWTDVVQSYGTAAAAGKAIAVFVALSYWWFGEHGSRAQYRRDRARAARATME